MSTEAKDQSEHANDRAHEPGHHAVEVKVVYEDTHAVIVASWDEQLHEIKKRLLGALEIPPSSSNEYSLRFDGHDITDEAQSLIHLDKDRVRHQLDFHLEHVLIYRVNGEEETTTRRRLTVRAILESAGFEPVTSYSLKSEKPLHDYGASYDEEVEIHQGQPFQAIFNGPTPTS